MELALILVASVVAAVGVVSAVTFLRFRWLCRRPGAVIASLGTAGRRRRARLGVLRMHSQRIDWYSARILSPFPSRRWARGDFEIVSRHEYDGLPGHAAYAAVCRARGHEITLIMSQRAYAGLASWYESAPPHVSARVF